MRVASFLMGDRPSYGTVGEAGVRPAPADFIDEFADLKTVLRRRALAGLEKAVQPVAPIALHQVTFLPVIPNPAKVICVGINYVTHIREMGRDMPEHPWLFVRFGDSQTGHEQPLIRPMASDKFDYEGELAVVVSEPAHHVKAADAFHHVAGYSCFNDGSLRDFQRHSSQFTAGKNFSRSGSMGPWLVTRDEIPDPNRLTLETRLNGEVMQSATVDDLLFGIPELIEYITTFTQLEAGDVIATGTPGGVGVARQPPVFMRPGDVVEVDISGIGILRNPVADEAVSR